MVRKFCGDDSRAVRCWKVLLVLFCASISSQHLLCNFHWDSKCPELKLRSYRSPWGIMVVDFTSGPLDINEFLSWECGCGWMAEAIRTEIQVLLKTNGLI